MPELIEDQIQDLAELNRNLYRRFGDARQDWQDEARKSVDFYLGNHFTEQESSDLRSIGQADFIIDRIYAAVEKFVSLVTARPPKFSAVGREDSDYKKADAWKYILEWIWDNSDGDRQFKQAVYDYSTAGLGWWYAYLDSEADYGRGEIKFRRIDWSRVYVDPAARDRYCQDASDILLSTILTADQIINIYPHLKEAITNDEIEPWDGEEDYPTSQRKNSSKSFTPDETKDLDWFNRTKFQVIERFTKTKVTYYRVERQDGQSKVLTEEQYLALVVDIGEENVEELEKAGLMAFVPVPQTRIRTVATVGKFVLYDQILSTDIYPLVPIANVWTETPYPKSDISKVIDEQRLLDKLFSLSLAHAQSSAGLKLLLPSGSVDDMEQLQMDWANPNAVIEYNPEFGEPHYPNPAPLATEFYHLIDRVEHYIDLTLGIPELLQGFRESAPETVRGTAMLAEFGESRGKSKLRDIEGGLRLMGQVIYNLARAHYTFPKVFRLIGANNDRTEFGVNFYDDKSQAAMDVVSNINEGNYDIRLIGNSTLPSNQMQELEVYRQDYQLGIIDQQEVLKKSPVYDKQGVMERMGQMQQMQSALEQSKNKIKDLEGKKQRLESQLLNAEREQEVQKSKSNLSQIQHSSKAKKDTELADFRAELKKILDELRLELKQARKQGKAPEKGVKAD